MKRFFILLVATLLTFTFANVKADGGKLPKKKAKTNIGVTFVPAEKNAIMVFFGNNTEKERVTIKIHNVRGELIYYKNVSNEKYGIKYLFYDAPKGDYTISVTDSSRELFSKKVTVI